VVSAKLLRLSIDKGVRESSLKIQSPIQTGIPLLRANDAISADGTQ
jgi:hypothetical protein